MSAALPPDVARTVERYRGLIAGETAPALFGLYLVGSLALDDYRPGLSDIDIVAVLAAPPTPAEVDALARVHAALPEPAAPHLDGLYPTIEDLRQPPPEDAVMPFSVEGRFRSSVPCREANPAVWRCLARHGRTVFGPAPATLGIADDGAILCARQRANLRGYWRDWIAECETALARKAPGEDCSAAALAWGVLGVGRIACTLETGRIVSKGEGGRHALATRPERWHRVIAQALSAHSGNVTRVPVASLRDGLGYMRVVIDDLAGRDD